MGRLEYSYDGGGGKNLANGRATGHELLSPSPFIFNPPYVKHERSFIIDIIMI